MAKAQLVRKKIKVQRKGRTITQTRMVRASAPAAKVKRTRSLKNAGPEHGPMKFGQFARKHGGTMFGTMLGTGVLQGAAHVGVAHAVHKATGNVGHAHAAGVGANFIAGQLGVHSAKRRREVQAMQHDVHRLGTGGKLALVAGGAVANFAGQAFGAAGMHGIIHGVH